MFHKSIPQSIASAVNFFLSHRNCAKHRKTVENGRESLKSTALSATSKDRKFIAETESYEVNMKLKMLLGNSLTPLLVTFAFLL